MWTITVTLDEGREDCGTITGTWTEGADVFTFSMRSLTDDKSKDLFLDLAIAARDGRTKRKAAEAAITAATIAKVPAAEKRATDKKEVK